MEKLTKQEFDFLIKLLEKKKRGCGLAIDNSPDNKIAKNAHKVNEMVIGIMGKLESMEKNICEKPRQKSAS